MASKTPVPIAAILSCPLTGRVPSGSSLPSGARAAVGLTTPSQSSRVAVKPCGSGPPVPRTNRVAPIGATDAASHFSVGAADASSAARIAKRSRVAWFVVYGAMATMLAPSVASAGPTSSATLSYAAP